MDQNPEHAFLGQIAIWDAQDEVEETFNLFLDLDTYEVLVCASSLPDGDPKTHYGLRAFLHRVPEAEPVVRRLILDKLESGRAAHEAGVEMPFFDSNRGAKPSGNLGGLRTFHGIR